MSTAVAALGVVWLVSLSGCALLEGMYNDPEDESDGDVGVSDTDLRDAQPPDADGPETDIPDVGPPTNDGDCPAEADFEFDGQPAEPGDACGPCEDGELVCDGSDELQCEGASDGNVCGGCEPLEQGLGEPCGPCEIDAYECDGTQLVCSGETPCPEFLSSDVSIEDVTNTSATFSGELLELPPWEAEVGFCWDVDPNPVQNDNHCTSLGEIDEVGYFFHDVDELEPGEEYFVQAYLETDEVSETSAVRSFETIVQLNFVTEPENTQIAGEAFDVVVEVLNQDDQRLEVDGVEVTLELNQNEFGDGSDEATATTDGEGVAEFNLTVNQAAAGYELTAFSDDDAFDGEEQTSVTFAVEASQPYEGESWIHGEDDAVAANGVDEAAVIVILRDKFENPIAGVTPDFEAAGDGNDYLPCFETNAEGVAECAMTSTEVGEKTLQITDPVDVVGETIEFVTCVEDGTPFGGGDGSEEAPHRICTPEHLNEIDDDDGFLEEHFLVTEDIDMSGVDFNVIGPSESSPFTGEFDGGGYEISNLTIERPDEDWVGLFGYVHFGAIENVILEGADIHGNGRVGGLVGNSAYATIKRSHVTGTITGDDDYIGGLVGRAAGGEISDSHTNCHVDGPQIVGGLVGESQTDISKSHAECDVDGSEQVGGLVGRDLGGRSVSPIRSVMSRDRIPSGDSSA